MSSILTLKYSHENSNFEHSFSVSDYLSSSANEPTNWTPAHISIRFKHASGDSKLILHFDTWQECQLCHNKILEGL